MQSSTKISFPSAFSSTDIKVLIACYALLAAKNSYSIGSLPAFAITEHSLRLD